MRWQCLGSGYLPALAVRFCIFTVLEFLNRETFRLFSLFLLLVLPMGCSEPTRKEIDEAIASSPRLSEADRICAQLPVPEAFRFVERRFFANSEYGVVVYRYATEMKAAEAAAFFKANLPKGGWELVAESPEEPRHRLYLQFRGDQKFVSVARTGIGRVNFNVNCGVIAAK